MGQPSPAEGAHVKGRTSLAFVLIIVLTVAITGALYLEQPKPATSYLHVHVSVSPAIVPYGQGAVLLTFWETNSLPQENNVSVAPYWARGNFSWYPCFANWPLGFQVVQGHVAINNYTSAKLVEHYITAYCQLSPAVFQSFAFLPDSSVAVTRSTSQFTRTWDTKTNTTYTGLAPGEYTAIAADEWGHYAFAYFSVTNSGGNSSALQLSLRLSANSITSGDSIGISVSEYNALPAANNVTAASLWPVPYLSAGPCGADSPDGFAVLSGRYSSSNISSAANPLKLYEPGPYFCPLMLSSGISSYNFHPASYIADIYGLCSPEPCITDFATNSTSVVSGTWSGSDENSAVFSAFPPGDYTVVAGDEWGHYAFAYFTVTG